MYELFNKTSEICDFDNIDINIELRKMIDWNWIGNLKCLTIAEIKRIISN